MSTEASSVPRPPTSRRFTPALPELDEIAERKATSQAPTFALVDDRELSSQPILFDVACICDDFPASHRHGTGPCMGWCDQTCQAYRPVLLDRTSVAWEALLAEASRVAWPEHFACDLFRDWQLLTQDNAPDAFVWALRRLGTDLLRADYSNVAWQAVLAGHHPEALWYVWRGGRLHVVTGAEAGRCLASSDRGQSQ
jgi:hypothetical protein